MDGDYRQSMSRGGRVALWLLLGVLSVSAARAETDCLYVVDVGGVLGAVDVHSGAVTVIGDTGIVFTDIAFDPQGRLFGLTVDRFYEIDPATGAATDLGLHGLPEANALVAGVDPGAPGLFAAGSYDTWLYTIDPNSARATPYRDVGYSAWGDLAFLDDALYMTAWGQNLVRLDLSNTGPATLVGSFGSLNFYGMDTLDGVLYGTAGTCIYTLDATTATATVVSDYAGQGLGAAWGAAAPPPGPAQPDFTRYYEPCQLEIEPDSPGYTLPLDINDIANFAEVDAIISLNDVRDLIGQNGFAIFEPDASLRTRWDVNDDIVEPYRFLRDSGIPLFVTTDTMLHLYHVQFDETLRDIEERCFAADINDLTSALLDDSVALHAQFQGDLKVAARRNVAYLAVARSLMDPSAPVPAMATETVAVELARIEAHEGFAPSDIFIYEEDYSQYVPRGHYTRSETLQRYFKTLMWYGRMAFLLKGAEPWGPACEALVSPYDAKIQTLQAMLLATSLRAVQMGQRSGLDVWDRLYTVTAFYVGLADDLTPYDYLWALDRVFGDEYTVDDLANEASYLAIKEKLALLPKPRIYGGTGNVMVPPGAPPEALDEVLDKTAGFRLMGQRFVPDSYMFQHLVFPQVGQYLGGSTSAPFTLNANGARGYPRGLDVMALLGSEPATDLLIDAGDTNYVDYWQRVGELAEAFSALTDTDWHANLYWSWLHTLRALLEEPSEGYPNFMRTQAWQRHQLHTALASWTELRHDTTLYAKQSYTPREIAVPVPRAYVEPAAPFWARLLALAQMTSRGLEDLDVLSDEARQRLDQTQAILARLLDVTTKQLTHQPLASDDEAFIANLADRLGHTVVGVEDAGVKTTLVADVHTEAGDKMVLEEAVGKVDLIVVVCPAPDGSVFLAVGPVLSYYEFKQPMSERLTDEAWRDRLDSPDRPDRPKWYRPLVNSGASTAR